MSDLDHLDKEFQAALDRYTLERIERENPERRIRLEDELNARCPSPNTFNEFGERDCFRKGCRVHNPMELSNWRAGMEGREQVMRNEYTQGLRGDLRRIRKGQACFGAFVVGYFVVCNIASVGLFGPICALIAFGISCAAQRPNVKRLQAEISSRTLPEAKVLTIGNR